jgi:hypothetical protein
MKKKVKDARTTKVLWKGRTNVNHAKIRQLYGSILREAR